MAIWLLRNIWRGGLTAYIHRAAPRLVIHGHQHVDVETERGRTRIIGVHGVRRVDLP